MEGSCRNHDSLVKHAYKDYDDLMKRYIKGELKSLGAKKKDPPTNTDNDNGD